MLSCDDTVMASCAARLRAALADPASIADAELQDLLAAAVRLYAAKADERAVAAFRPGQGVTANDVMITATEMLRAVDVQVFELSLWQTMCGVDQRG
jgi:hypothetical protein